MDAFYGGWVLASGPLLGVVDWARLQETNTIIWLGQSMLVRTLATVATLAVATAAMSLKCSRSPQLDGFLPQPCPVLTHCRDGSGGAAGTTVWCTSTGHVVPGTWCVATGDEVEAIGLVSLNAIDQAPPTPVLCQWAVDTEVS